MRDQQTCSSPAIVVMTDIVRGILPLALGLMMMLGLSTTEAAGADTKSAGTSHWWKGNTHTHTFWSDGDDFPEMVAAWYKENGYHFLVLSDHNVVLKGEKWAPIPDSGDRAAALDKYVARHGAEWVIQKQGETNRLVKLKTLEEFRRLFEEPGRFLMMPGEELSARYKVLPIHMNVVNVGDLIQPQGGESVLEVLQNNVDAVLEQRRRTGVPMVPHINHPNFGWALTAEDIMQVRGERFFEVYNGHPSVRNHGDDTRAGTERMWDIILAFRLAELGLEPMYGIAVDDAHHYHTRGPKQSNTGRGWIVVRAPELKADALIAGMEAGEFYASSGVRLTDVRAEKKSLSVEIDPEPGVTYTTQFIGTRKGFDRASEPVHIKDSPFPTTRRYSPEIGVILAEVEGTSPRYVFKGDEIYVRAKVVSSKLKDNPYAEGEMETAWVQPVVTGVK